MGLGFYLFMDISIIIPSYNTRDLLRRCLNSIVLSLRDSKLSYEVIVVDNGSMDGTVSNLKSQISMTNKEGSKLTVIENKENVGYGRANNQGIKIAKGEYILLLNSDICVIDDAIDKLYAFTKKQGNVFVGGKLFNENRSEQTSCGPFFNLPVVFAALLLQGDRLGLTRWSPSVVREVDWISGACIMAKKSAFINVGLFDETIFMYMEEIDLLFRARQKGYRTIFFPSAGFVHTGAASSSDKRSPVGNIYQGLVYFYKKHYGKTELAILKMILRIKANLAIGVGKLLKNEGLIHVYEKALELAER